MLKRILVLLGETPSSLSARRHAVQRARHLGAEVTGLAGVDMPYIQAAMPGAIGASAYRARLEEELRKQAQEVQARLHSAFEQECREHGVACELLSFEGDPVEMLYLASEGHDLLVAGYDTTFRGDAGGRLSETLAKLLLATPRPLVICPDELPDADAILVSYDGSIPSMRSIQMFALLGMGRDRSISVISIDGDGADAQRKAASAAHYLRIHDYQAEARPVASRAHPSEILDAAVAEQKAGTLVMGAYGHRGFRELLFGSTTEALVENPPCALFLYH